MMHGNVVGVLSRIPETSQKWEMVGKRFELHPGFGSRWKRPENAWPAFPRHFQPHNPTPFPPFRFTPIFSLPSHPSSTSPLRRLYRHSSRCRPFRVRLLLSSLVFLHLN
ncbi:hypothetical protein RJT34_19601 [Clitoria ternatea]|uniref:Uncharacterized protein n=1 Tax=Clitoria ternatea TaxID=43366 RepID=A0AAN9IRR9_CLITE